jgi:hypothetical protein
LKGRLLTSAAWVRRLFVTLSETLHALQCEPSASREGPQRSSYQSPSKQRFGSNWKSQWLTTAMSNMFSVIFLSRIALIS